MTRLSKIKTCFPLAAALAISTLSAAAQDATPNSGLTAAAKAAVPVGIHELSPWTMFMNADLVVKAVMIGLVVASLVTWTIFVGKLVELYLTRRGLQRALELANSQRSLDDAYVQLAADRSVMRRFVGTAINEARLSSGLDGGTGIKERCASSFTEIVRTESRRIRIGMGLLATIAATSPFVGLFGTVWGIMNSFIGISRSQTTNLAVVAPGIAEALLATAIGLIAAIPAVIIYNHFSRVTRGYLDVVSRAAGAASRLLSRDLERVHLSPLRRAAE
jgi:biopolymer transport protein ExbB